MTSQSLLTPLQTDNITSEIYLKRLEEIQYIRQQSEQIKDIFEDISLLVQTQGNDIISIESSVENANSDVQTGLVQIREAAIKQKTSRKCILCFFLVVAVFVTCLACIIILAYRNTF